MVLSNHRPPRWSRE